MTEPVKIRCKGRPGVDLVCQADGTPIPMVRSVYFYVDFDDMRPIADIQVLVQDVEVDAQGTMFCKVNGRKYELVPFDREADDG